MQYFQGCHTFITTQRQGVCITFLSTVYQWSICLCIYLCQLWMMELTAIPILWSFCSKSEWFLDNNVTRSEAPGLDGHSLTECWRVHQNTWIWVALQCGISLKLHINPVLRTAVAYLICVLFHSENKLNEQQGRWSRESYSFQEKAKVVTKEPGCFQVRSQINRHSSRAQKGVWSG